MRRYERGTDGTFHDGLLMDLLAENCPGSAPVVGGQARLADSPNRCPGAASARQALAQPWQTTGQLRTNAQSIQQLAAALA